MWFRYFMRRDGGSGAPAAGRALVLGLAAFAALSYFALRDQPAIGQDPPAPVNPEAQAPAVAAAEEPAEYQLENISGRGGPISCIAGKELEQEFTVRVLKAGEPAAGEWVLFSVVSTPGGSAEDIQLSSPGVLTNDEGEATTVVRHLAVEGDYVVAALVDGDAKIAPPANLTINAIEPAWMLFMIIGLLGGLAMFLYGMDLVGSNLQKVAGDSLRTILSTLTKNAYYGAGLGVVITFLLQSVSASTVLVVGLVSATLMTLTQAIGVIIGAKIGIAITVQIIAFNVSKYALAFVFAGLLTKMIAKNKKVMRVGLAVMGFGLLFFGLAMMSRSMAPLRAMPEVTDLLVQLGESPVLAVIGATLFTAVIQSAVATIGIAMALSSQGMLPLEAAIPIAMGGAVGTCATALLASLGSSREGKQVAVAHLLFSIISVAICLPFMGYLVDLTLLVSGWLNDTSVVRQIANGFTLYAVITGVVLLPASKLLEKLTLLLIPPEDKPAAFAPKYLQKSSIPFPAIAIEQAFQEMIRMSQIVLDQMMKVEELIEFPDEEEIAELRERETEIDLLERAIRRFLTEVGAGELSKDLSARERSIVYIAASMEEQGDEVAESMVAALERLVEKKAQFPEEAVLELQQYLERVMNRYLHVVHGAQAHDLLRIQKILDDTAKEEEEARRLKDKHMDRLHEGVEAARETSGAHLALIDAMVAIDRHTVDIARTVHEDLPH